MRQVGKYIYIYIYIYIIEKNRKEKSGVSRARR